MTVERWTDDMIDGLAGNVQDLTRDVQALLRIAMVHQESLEGQRLQMNAAIERMDQAIIEIRAGQQRQEAILDYLVRRDGQRGDPA
jgi:hypothetical protein